MKISIHTIAAVAIALVLSAATPAVKAADVNYTTTLEGIKNINKVVVNGNVELILVQDAKERVKVYDNYYAKNALVQQDGSVLRISSFGKEKLTVVAYVNTLSSIEAANTSTVTTYGKFSLLGLDIILKNNATANINATSISLYTSVKDNASLKLAGTAINYAAVVGSTAKVNMEQFVADSSTIRSTAPVLTAKRSWAQDIREAQAAYEIAGI